MRDIFEFADDDKLINDTDGEYIRQIYRDLRDKNSDQNKMFSNKKNKEKDDSSLLNDKDFKEQNMLEVEIADDVENNSYDYYVSNDNFLEEQNNEYKDENSTIDTFKSENTYDLNTTTAYSSTKTEKSVKRTMDEDIKTNPKLFEYDYDKFLEENKNNKNIKEEDLVDKKSTSYKTVDYNTFLNSLYSKEINKKNTPKVNKEIAYDVKPSNVDYLDLANVNFLSIKNSLHEKNYVFKQYIKKDTLSFYVNKYYFINRVYMDAFLIMYVFVAIQAFITHFALKQTYGLQPWGLLVVLVCLFIFPLGSMINYFTNMKHKTKQKYALRTSLGNSMILMLNFILIIGILAYFVFNAKPNEFLLYLYTPILFTLNIPATTLVISLLSKSQRYYIR